MKNASQSGNIAATRPTATAAPAVWRTAARASIAPARPCVIVSMSLAYTSKLFRMPTYKLVLEYDGTRYRGWQAQKNTDRTVAAAVERAARELFGEEVRVHGAGRTDAGVHALAQVAHFKVKKRHSGQEILYGLNDRLPF